MSLKSRLLDLLFPVHCLACRRESTWLCDQCFSQLNFNSQTYPFLAPELTRLFVAGDYNNQILAELIKQLKFNRVKRIGPLLGRFLIIFWKKILTQQSAVNKKPNFLNEPLLIIPIPLSKKRQKDRGFNQAEELARPFGDYFNYRLNFDLKRRGHQAPQSSLSENKRKNNIRNAFLWSGSALAGQSIMLVDDVATTGATLDEAARVLKLAGAGKIYGLVVAKG